MGPQLDNTSTSDGAVLEFDPSRPLRSTPIDTLIIGCGNILRGDDAAGTVSIRRMWERGLPDRVQCADGGTGGMDVAFQMHDVPHVILIDASQTGHTPGTLFEIPGEEVEQLPPMTGIHLHAFRWDHAIAFARWLLKDRFPQRVTVYLIEGERFQVGEGLSPSVDQAIDRLLDRLFETFDRPMQRGREHDVSNSDFVAINPDDGVPSLSTTVEFTVDGYLRMACEDATRFFPEDVLVPFVKDKRLFLMPTRGAAAGGMVLKQRNAEGDRSLLLKDAFGFEIPPGSIVATWNDAMGGLELLLEVGNAMP